MKVKKGMKVLMILTSLLTILCLSACSSEAKVPGFDVSVRPSDSSDNDNSSSDNSSGNNASDSSSNNSSSNNSSSNTSPSNTLAILTPPGAKIIQDVEGSAVMQSDKDLQELINFYQTALKELGAKKEVSNQIGNMWDYVGTYNNGEDIVINIFGSTIQITY